MLKNILILAVLVFAFNIQVVGQELFKNNPDVFSSTELKSATVATQYLPNGGCFTPKGSLKALIIFASFGGTYDNQAVAGWPSSSIFPDWANSSTKSFYTTEAEFTNSASDTNIKSVSKFYYDMSNPSQKLKLFVDYYPSRVIVDASTCTSWGAVNKKVIAQIPSSFNWGTYDSRKNDPSYLHDYSSSSTDTKPDFVIICYRFSYSWASFPLAAMGDQTSGWCGGCNGVSSNYLTGTTSNGYTFTSAGFTHVTGATDIAWMFLHETGHELYDAPHYNGNNGVAGDYFYIPTDGWGMMSMNTFSCALGWERWIMDWVDAIKANGVNSDVKTTANLPANGEFTLRDYITTGDMVRIQIPNGGIKNQYLWIENHQGKSIFDNNGNPNPYCGANIPNPPRGIIAYVETINDNKNSITNYTNGNGIRWLHADGNYDFNFDPTPLNPSLAYCSNTTYNITKGASNPIGGQNTGEYIRKDFDNNGLIYNKSRPGSGLDNSARNEGTPVVVYNGNTSADYFMGKNMAFVVNQKAGMAENPVIMNIPTFDSINNKMNSYYLNGISFKVVSQDAQGNIKIQVKLDDIDINKNIRMAGTSIVLTNITGNSNPDINLLEGKKITINRSGTENTRTLIDGKCIRYTNFSCENGSFFKMQPNSTVSLDENSTFTLKSGSTLEINDGAQFIVKNGAKLQVESGATIIIKGTGGIIVKCLGTLCVNSGATLNLQDFASSIHFLGTGGLSPNCLSNLSGVLSGNGNIRNYTSATTVNNTTINADTYYNGTSITSTNVNVQGSGTDLIYSITDGATINGTFEIPLGSTFEVKVNSTGCTN